MACDLDMMTTCCWADTDGLGAPLPAGPAAERPEHAPATGTGGAA